MPVRYLSEHGPAAGSFEGARVLARFDFNVPLKGGQIADATRLDTALPTIRHLLDRGVSKLVLMAHLGRPKGQFVESLSFQPVGDYLAERLNQEIILTGGCLDSSIRRVLDLGKTKVILLENLRFHPEETEDDREFARILSTYGDFYVNDAFGACHRKHASIHAINAFYTHHSFGGLLLQKEVESIGKLVGHPDPPFLAVIGGAKVADKMPAIQALLPRAKNILLGGAMAYPLLKMQGVEIGKSLCSDEELKMARDLLAVDKNKKIVLPLDHIAGEDVNAAPVPVPTLDIPPNLMGLDIGPRTLEHYCSLLDEAKTVFWNGPMGLFENPDYSAGTTGIARTMATLSAYTVVGGGDSVSAVKQSGVTDQIGHVSTGGGASLEFIEKGGNLPGIQALKFGLD